jgi:aspartyl-tRNA(Asn)/glutamyl-tRNA(Gln) amidotransferase subunit C
MSDATGQDPITPDVVRQVAKLVRLALDEAHVEKYAGQLASILGYVDKIKSADVEGVEPMAHAAPLHNVLRDDAPRAPLPTEAVLQNAPEADGPFFKVPKVIGGDEDSAG